MSSTRTSGAKIGLALAGGGPVGAIYEIGALRALDEALDGIDLNDLSIYVGVSAGSFVTACLANGITPARLCRLIVTHEPGEPPFSPDIFFKPAVARLIRGGLTTPRLFLEAVWGYVCNPEDQSALESLARMSRALPVGVFENEPIREFLHEAFSRNDRTDDFRELDRRLVLVAADLDSGEAVRFGEPGMDHVPISRAVQASCALPGVYPPVIIDDRYYVDGVLLKTLHASVAMDEGAGLVLCVNPIVPVDTADAVEAGIMRRGKLFHRGLPTVLSQSFRTLIHSRLTVGMASYRPRYPDTDVILLEPRRDDYRMFFTNVFRFSSRRAVCAHAYRNTRRELLERREEIEPILERHGIGLRVDLLEDDGRELWTGLGLESERSQAPVAEKLDRALSRLEALLQDE